MKGTDRFSKSTVRKAIDSEGDPYLPKTGPKDGAVCRECGAVYLNKRWTLEPKAQRSVNAEETVKVLCPACQKIRDRFIGGFVTIQGGFIKEHRDEILNMVRNKEERSKHYNPLDRIMEIKDMEDSIEITTTTEKLAQRIGRMLKKAFSGKVEYKWSSDVKIARVVWTRE